MSRSPRLLAGLLLSVAASGLAACAAPDGDVPADASAAAPALPPRDLAALSGPSAWQGELPCADCAGIRTTLTLAPDGTYRRSAAYLGTNGGGDTILTDIGRWTLANGNTRVTLRGSTDAPPFFAVDADGTLRQLDLEGNDITSAANYRLDAIAEPVTITHPSRLVAAFTYLADAAIAVECGSGLQFPVAMTGAYLEVERAYTGSGVRAGAPLVMRLRAHLDEVTGGDGDGRVLSWVVDSLLGVEANDGCAAQRTQDAIAAHPWRLVAIEGDAGALPVPDGSRADFTWDRTEGRFTGNSGCNRYSARGTLRGTTLAAGAAIGTRMACLSDELNAIEARMLALLAAQPSLRVDADTLVWSVGPSDVARFVPAGGSGTRD